MGAIVFALLAALCNAVSVLTRHVASTADPDRPTGLRLVGYLLRNPRWLAGSAAQVGAFAFQAVALQLGQLSVVQPLLVTELVMALVLRQVFIHQEIAWAAWGGAAAAVAGLAVFIVAAEPRGGHDGADRRALGGGGGGLRRRRRVADTPGRSGSPTRRAALYGLAGGITWAVEATFIKSATNDLARAGLAGLFSNWPVYAVAVGGAAGVVIEQAALQSGPLRVSQPLLTITDPIVSIALSVWLFGEYFVLNPAVLAAAAAGFLVMCAGVVVLSLTAPATVEGDADPARGRRGPFGMRFDFMIPLSFNSLLIIAGISVLVPVVLGLLPRLPVPGAVLMVLGGIVVGPSVLNWARIDAPVEVLSDLGLGILLFLAGLEIDVDRLRSPLTRLAGIAFGCSAALAVLCACCSGCRGRKPSRSCSRSSSCRRPPGCCCRC